MPFGWNEEEYNKPHVCGKEEAKEVMDAKDMAFYHLEGKESTQLFKEGSDPDGFEPWDSWEAGWKRMRDTNLVLMNKGGWLKVISEKGAREKELPGLDRL